MGSRNTATEDPEATKKKQKVADSLRHYYGLYNQGATCYLNSVLQVLFMTPEFHDRLDPESQGTEKELRNLFKDLRRKECGTEKITQSLEISDVHKQCDAAQYLEKILEKVSPAASQVFRGELKYKTMCTESHCINEEENSFWTLPLALKDATNETFNVESGFEKMFEPKLFRGDNMVYCSECEKKKEATSGCDMKEFPCILVLLLKRFDFDYNTMSHFKSHRYVEVPRFLQRKNQTFKLYGIVNHMGSLKGGHYKATIWSEENQTWYEFNDSDVREVEEQPFVEKKTYESNTAYLLVYRASAGTEQDQIESVDEQEGNKGEHGGMKRKETHYRGKRDQGQNKESKQKKKPTNMGQIESRNRKEMEPLCHHQMLSKQKHTDIRTTAKEKDGHKHSTIIKKKPLLIFSIIFGCIFLLIVIPVTVIFS